MVIESRFDLGHHVFREPFVSNCDDGLQSMRKATQVFFLAGGK